MNKTLLSVVALIGTIVSLTANAQVDRFGGRPGMSRPGGFNEGSIRNRPNPNENYPTSVSIDANPLIPWIQNVNSLSQNLMMSAQQVTLSQGDYSVAMQKLGQAQQLLIEVANLMQDMVPQGVCAMIYEETNYTGPGYEILPIRQGDFSSEWMYSSFSRFPVYQSGRSFPARVNLNDRISSVAVKRGCKLNLHEHDGFRGYFHSYNTNAPGLFADNQYSSATCSCPPSAY